MVEGGGEVGVPDLQIFHLETTAVDHLLCRPYALSAPWSDRRLASFASVVEIMYFVSVFEASNVLVREANART